MTPPGGKWVLGRALLALALGMAFGGIGASVAPADAPEVHVLSNRADLISGGDALVEIELPRGIDAGAVSIVVDGRDVTSAFGMRPDGRFAGLVDGLKVGPNALRVHVPAVGSAELSITNHPIGGPVFAGTQTQPWVCKTEENDLGKPLDAQCNAATKFDHLYISSNPSKVGFQPYDPSNPPTDVAQTTTDHGVTAPFIVRRERGVIDRGIYQFVVLADPKEGWEPWDPQKTWNRKLYWSFGGDCKPNHVQPADTSALNQNVLGKGFAVADSGMTVLGKNCNNETSAESVMMIKERIVESLGPIRYTMSDGCSGGSMQQHWIVSNYPGLVDGIQPSCSYPDIWETMQEAEDCHILDNYFTYVSPHLWANPAQQDAVTGYLAPSTCHSFWDGPPPLNYSKTWFDPTNAPGCGLPAEEVYDPESNPTGVRCTLQDYMLPVFGQRSQDGFANRPYDNVGVQYGLNALNDGDITPDQFVDLNQKVGGLDIDWNYTPERSVADPPALEVAYRAGLVTYPRAAATVPIIDLRGSSNLEIHTDFHSYAMRERLIQANGGYGNQIIWTDPQALAGDQTKTAQSFELLDRWLGRIEADKSDRPLAAKVLANKPADAVDACWIAGKKITDMQKCRAAFPYFADPRIAAGGPLADNVLKCQLKPLDKRDYNGTFSDAQWRALEQAFPQGVCDYNRPGVAQQPSIPWMTFADGPGGRPLGPPPTSKVTGCTDRTAPKTRFAARSIKAATGSRGTRRLRLSGRVTDRGCGGRKGTVTRVVISVARQAARTGRGERLCRNLKSNGRFTKRSNCHRFLYIKARHKGERWSFVSTQPVPPGFYRIRVKAIDASGNRERPGKKTNTRRIRRR